MAIVAVKPGHTLTPAEIHAHCAANLARFKCPRLIEFVDALPRNATGKIHKPTLRQKFSATEGHRQSAVPHVAFVSFVRRHCDKTKKPAGSSPAGSCSEAN